MGSAMGDGNSSKHDQRREEMERVASEKAAQRRETLLRLLSLSGSMSGISIGLVSLFRTSVAVKSVDTVADDLLCICGLMFLCTNLLSFWALRSYDPRRLSRWAVPAELLFIVAMIMLVGIGFMMVYTLL